MEARIPKGQDSSLLTGIIFSQLKCSCFIMIMEGEVEEENVSGQQCSLCGSRPLWSCCHVPRGEAGTGEGRSRCSSDGVFPGRESLSRRDPQKRAGESQSFPRHQDALTSYSGSLSILDLLVLFAQSLGSSMAYPRGYNMKENPSFLYPC